MSTTRSASVSRVSEYMPLLLTAIEEANRLAQEEELYFPPLRVRPLFWEQHEDRENDVE